MTCLDPFPHYVNTNILMYPTDCWLNFFVFDGRRYPYHINMFTSRALDVFPALPLNEICSARTLLTFLTTETYDCSFWKFSFKRLISSVGEAIVGLVYPGVFRNRSIFWFLFNALSVSKVYIQTIASTRLLWWQKIVVK